MEGPSVTQADVQAKTPAPQDVDDDDLQIIWVKPPSQPDNIETKVNLRMKGEAWIIVTMDVPFDSAQNDIMDVILSEFFPNAAITWDNGVYKILDGKTMLRAVMRPGNHGRFIYEYDIDIE